MKPGAGFFVLNEAENFWSYQYRRYAWRLLDVHVRAVLCREVVVE